MYDNHIDDNNEKNLHAIDGIGFLAKTIYIDKDVTSINLSFYSTKDNKQWSYVPTKGGSYFFGNYLGIYKNTIYLYIYSFKSSIYVDNAEVFIIGIDATTRKELFKKPAEGKFTILPKNIKVFNDGEAYVFGSYYKKNVNFKKDKSKGFALWKIKEDLTIIDEKYVSWDNDFNDYVNLTDKGKIEGVGYLYFHDVVQLTNGDIYLLAEGSRKVIDGINVAVDLLSYGLFGGIPFLNEDNSPLKKVSTEMVVIKLNPSFKITGVNIFDKKNSDYFSYVATQSIDKSNNFSFWYLSNNSSTLNSINLISDAITTNQISVTANTTKSIVLPSHNQSILVLDYYKSGNIVKLNFKNFN